LPGPPGPAWSSAGSTADRWAPPYKAGVPPWLLEEAARRASPGHPSARDRALRDPALRAPASLPGRARVPVVRTGKGPPAVPGRHHLETVRTRGARRAPAPGAGRTRAEAAPPGPAAADRTAAAGR